jgi:hypothetical protein
MAWQGDVCGKRISVAAADCEDVCGDNWVRFSILAADSISCPIL